MPAPDARQDLAGAINYLAQMVAELAASMRESGTMTIAEIAEDQGVSTRTVHAQVWRLPSFGAHPVSGKPLKFRKSDYLAWMAPGLAARREEWDALPFTARRAL